MMRSTLIFCLASVCSARFMQSFGHEDSARTWELQNTALRHSGDFHAELVMANFKQATHDPSLLAYLARGSRHPADQRKPLKFLADHIFQRQMKSLIEVNGLLSDFLRLEIYAREEKTKDGSRGSLTNLLLALNPTSPAHAASARTASARTVLRMETISYLKELAKAQNPVAGYFDPLKLSEDEFWGQSNEATIGWVRHAEIKPGQVAMAGFVGYFLNQDGVLWPWELSISLPDYSPFEFLSAPVIWMP